MRHIPVIHRSSRQRNSRRRMKRSRASNIDAAGTRRPVPVPPMPRRRARLRGRSPAAPFALLNRASTQECSESASWAFYAESHRDLKSASLARGSHCNRDPIVKARSQMVAAMTPSATFDAAGGTDPFSTLSTNTLRSRPSSSRNKTSSPSSAPRTAFPKGVETERWPFSKSFTAVHDPDRVSAPVVREQENHSVSDRDAVVGFGDPRRRALRAHRTPRSPRRPERPAAAPAI